MRIPSLDLLAAEVAVHQGLVLALGDDPLDQLVAGLVDRRQVLGVGVADRRRVAGGVVEDPLGDQARCRPTTTSPSSPSMGR